VIDKNKKYELKELESMLYSAADTFHGSGNLNNLEILNVAIPTIFLKRVLDLRADYIVKELKESVDYEFDGAIPALKNSYKDINKAFNVLNNDEWFFVTYQDILNYQDNESGEEKTISLDIDSNIKLTTTARNRVDFVKELHSNLSHDVVKAIFKQSRYFTLYLGDKLGFKECNILFNKFAPFHFGDNVSTDIFSQAYIYLISVFAASGGQKGGEFFTPDPICRAVIACLEPKLNDFGKTKVADITSGSATFLIEFGRYIAQNYGKDKAVDNLEFYMQEKEEQTLVLGEAGLLLAGFESITAYHGNTLLNYKENIGQHRNLMDYVVGNPPYGTKILQKNDFDEIKGLAEKEQEERWSFGIPPKAELEWFFVQSALDMTHDEGKVALVLPLGTLFKKNTRKKMRELGYIEGIIALPDNMFQTTTIPTCIWIFNKNKKAEDKGKIFFVNAANEAWKDGKFNTIDYDKLREFYTSRTIEEGYAGYVDDEILESNADNYTHDKYIFKEVERVEVDIAALNGKSKQLSSQIQEKEDSMDLIFEMIEKIN
jgi:type I restriction-modification system DNA methylase subunit